MALVYTGNQQRMTVELGSDYTSGSGTMSLTAGHGARLPAVSSPDVLYLKPTETEITGGATYQVWKVTARSTDTLTVVGAQDGTTDTSVTAPMEMEWTLGEAALDQLRADLVLSDTYANLPSAGKAGRLFWPTDSLYQLRDNGSSWDHFAHGLFAGILTPPVDGDFSWVNQGSATVDATHGGVILSHDQVSGVNVRIRAKSAPSQPYTLIASIYSLDNVDASWWRWGIGLRESATGKLETLGIEANSIQVRHETWTSPTAYNGVPSSDVLSHATMRNLSFRIVHDGTNLAMAYNPFGPGFDGEWVTITSSYSKSTFFTTDADQLIFWVNSETSAQANRIWLMHWDASAGTP